MSNNQYILWINRLVILAFVTYLALSIQGCSSDRRNNEFVLRIRIADEPDCLHPVVSQSSLASQIEVLMMPPLFEYSPDKLEFSPILIDSLWPPAVINDSTIEYSYHIQSQAVWDDGHPVTAADVIYTIKSSLNPCIKNKTYAGFFKNIREVRTDSTDPKSIHFLINRHYMLGMEMSGNYCIYPEHIYDPGSIMRSFQLSDLISKDSASWSSQQWQVLRQYADTYQSAAFCKDKITGCGPYRLSAWNAGQKIVLEKKKNWWGDSLVNRYPLLTAVPDRIEYWVIPEEASAILELKNNRIDLLSEVTPKVFTDLQNSEKDHLRFYTPALMQYMYIEMNQRRPALNDLAVRRALSMLFDTDKFIRDQFNGLAMRCNSPVHPSKSYYNSSLLPYEFNPGEAIRILTEAGWKDSDNNGALDKMINNQKQELKFNFYLTNKELSKKIGLLLQEECKKAGILIELVPREAAALMKDLNELSFDLALMSQRQQPSLWDPYQSFSSQNILPGGFNKSGYHNATCDSLIQGIRSAMDERQRKEAYLALQQKLHDEVAQLFLFIPKERIVSTNQIRMEAYSRRPGYYEGMIRRQ